MTHNKNISRNTREISTASSYQRARGAGKPAPLQLSQIITLLLIGAVCVSAAPISKTYRVTAYCPNACCCGEFADGITASGHKIKAGDRFVAAPKNIPFGTELIIAGYNDGKPVKVLDRGGAIKGNKLDLYFDTHQEALNWGVKYIEVETL